MIKIAKEDAERKANEPERKPIPNELLEGRHEFVGTVLGFKDGENDYGTWYKMVFRDNRGFTLYGTQVSDKDSTYYDKGSRVSFFARITKSDKDETFGFYSRPTKVKILEVKK